MRSSTLFCFTSILFFSFPVFFFIPLHFFPQYVNQHVFFSHFFTFSLLLFPFHTFLNAFFHSNYFLFSHLFIIISRPFFLFSSLGKKSLKYSLRKKNIQDVFVLFFPYFFPPWGCWFTAQILVTDGLGFSIWRTLSKSQEWYKSEFLIYRLTPAVPLSRPPTLNLTFPASAAAFCLPARLTSPAVPPRSVPCPALYCGKIY